MGDDALARLKARMAQPPQDWVDVVMVAVLKDPLFYGTVAAGVFVVLALLALVATKMLLDQIAADERRKSNKRD